MRVPTNFAEKTPAIVIDIDAIAANTAVIADISRKSGATILLALKAFSTKYYFPVLRRGFAGTAASGLYEAKLGASEFGGEVHVCGPAYPESDIPEILSVASGITFNTPDQWKRWKPDLERSNVRHVGIRINPGISHAPVEKYDPCAPNSRLGTPIQNWDPQWVSEGVNGIHVHALCEQNWPALEQILNTLETQLSPTLHKLDWINLGGGHLLTKSDYDKNALCQRLNHFQKQFSIKVYLEPGSASVWDCGVLASRVLDVMPDQRVIILDTSFTCHMPDTLEMPYRPVLIGESNQPNAQAWTFGGVSCLAGDYCGTYQIDEVPQVGDLFIFKDMAHYTTVKMTQFNGVAKPYQYAMAASGELTLISEPNYSQWIKSL